jgi:hypothetical protein
MQNAATGSLYFVTGNLWQPENDAVPSVSVTVEYLDPVRRGFAEQCLQALITSSGLRHDPVAGKRIVFIPEGFKLQEKLSAEPQAKKWFWVQIVRFSLSSLLPHRCCYLIADSFSSCVFVYRSVSMPISAQSMRSCERSKFISMSLF